MDGTGTISTAGWINYLHAIYTEIVSTRVWCAYKPKW